MFFQNLFLMKKASTFAIGEQKHLYTFLRYAHIWIWQSQGNKKNRRLTSLNSAFSTQCPRVDCH